GRNRDGERGGERHADSRSRARAGSRARSRQRQRHAHRARFGTRRPLVTARRAAWISGGVMLAVYVATLAPDVTFWDAGEFIAATRVLGIPHPPGTPLYVVVLNAWAKLFWFLPFAVATNLFSAACTAAAVGITARWIAR